MPQIRDYAAQVDQLRPSETGVEAAAMEGRRIGAFGDQAANTLRQSGTDVARAAETKAAAVGAEDRAFGQAGKDITTAASQFQDYEAHREITQLQPKLAQRMSDLSDQYQAALSKADPAHADTAIAAFNEQTLEPAFNDMAEAATSPQAKKFVQDHIDLLRNHYYEKQSADKAQLAGIAVKNGIDQSDNAWSNTAFNDPSQLDGLVGKNGKPGLIDVSIGGLVDSNPNLRGVTGQQVKIDAAQTAKVNAVRSGFLGALGKTGDPDGLVKRFEEKYPDLIKPAELQQFAQAAKNQIKSNALVAKQTEVLQRQLDEQNVKSASAKSWADNVKWDDATGKPVINPQFGKDAVEIPKKFPNAPNAVETARTSLNWLQSRQKEDRPVDDPATLRDLTDRLYDFDNPTTRLDLMKANATGKLSDQKFSAMERLVTELQNGPLKEPIFKNAMEGAKKQVDAKYNGVDLNPGAYENFVHDFLPKYLAAKRSGQLEPDALDLTNPKSLISRSIAPYKSPMADVLKGSIAAGGGIPVPGAAPTVPPVKIATPADALKLKPGTRYVRPDGTVMTR